jgi:hypothetical protein
VRAGALAEGDRLHQRVPSEAVGAVNGDAGHLAGRVQPRQRRQPVEVGVDAAHVVVGAGANRNRLVDRVDPREHHRKLSGAVQALDDPLGAEVAEVEEHVAVDASPFVDLGLLGTRDHIAARELHRVRRVALEEAIALRVQQIGPFPAAALGDQDARRRKRRRMELHHLHVLERDADA